MNVRRTLKLLVLSPIFLGMTFAFQNCAPVAFHDLGTSDLAMPSQIPDPIIDPPPTVEKCRFNGQDLFDGDVVTAYLASSVPYGSSCQAEQRECLNGALSGSYAYATCGEDQPASCLFDGRTLAHMESLTAYQNSSVAFGQSCQSETRTCDNGTLSGTYNHSVCNVGQPAQCLFNGQNVAHGASVRAYQNSAVGFGSQCVSEDRVCSNGVLNGSFTFASCTPGQPAGCLFNGQTIAHGQRVSAFRTSSVSYGQTCAQEERLCTNGVLSGSHTFSTCAPGQPASCLFNGQTIAHGQSVVAFQSSTAAYGQQCISQTRTCQNGALSGSYTASTCTVPACVANQGQSCAASTTWYWKSAAYASLDACEMAKGNAGFQQPCPNPSAGYQWDGKQCRNEYAPTNGQWRAHLFCAQSMMGTVSCDGQCR